MKTLTEFSAFVCRRETPVRDVLGRIDAASPHLFQIVLDADGRLLGTVTDGDIRRAMLHGVGMDDTAADCMQAKPTTGQTGDTKGNRAALDRLGSTRAFLPVLDQDGRVAEVLIASGSDTIGSAVVMAGGAGRRLGERTRTTPKPLLTVGGRPILDHVLTALEDAGVRRVVLTVHYLAEQIEEFLEARENRADMRVFHEPEPLGTAGALGMLGADTPREPALIVNGDVITGADFAALHEFHDRHGHDGTLAVARYNVDIPFGVVRYGDDGVFDRIEEKPQVSHFVAAGVYYLSPAYFALVPEGKRMDMPELLNAGREIGLRTGLFPIHEYWTDVGRPADLDAASRRHEEAAQQGQGPGAPNGADAGKTAAE